MTTTSDGDELIFDAWTPMAFKRQLGSRSATGAGAGFAPPDWVGPEHRRRLMAYAILRSYQDNAAREFMLSEDRQDIDDRREYGDAALIVNTVLGALLGEDQAIVVDGADETNDGGPTPEAERAHALQEWLEQWADDERLPLKMIEGERRSIGLGDGVYSLGWSGEKGRPRLRVWDPAFYFPVLDDGNEDDYPERVHIAWELPDEDAPQGKRRVRRITWELGPIGADGDGTAGQRKLPWNDAPTQTTCYLSDATWTIDRASKRIDDLTEGTAEWASDEDGEVRMRDLGIDFIPVVHVPNTVSIIEHFGRSTLATVLQILDDLAAADTDLAAASATTGHPVIALEGGTVERDSTGKSRVTYRPGEILESGDGKLSVLDTSRALDALIKYIEFLLKRLSVNGRVAESLLGRVKPSEVPSGVALALSFGPTEQLVKEMRLVREEKYPLLLKFAHRIAVAGGATGAPADWIRARVAFGSFLPQDQADAVDLVTKLLVAKAVSLETAIAILVEAGFPIRDAAREAELIQSRDFDGAAKLLDATGDQGMVNEYLGRDPVDPPQPQPQPQPAGPQQDPAASDTAFDQNGRPLQQ